MSATVRADELPTLRAASDAINHLVSAARFVVLTGRFAVLTTIGTGSGLGVKEGAARIAFVSSHDINQKIMSSFSFPAHGPSPDGSGTQPGTTYLQGPGCHTPGARCETSPRDTA